MRTEIDLPNPGGRLYPGMYAQVSIETEMHPKVLALPAPAIGTDTKGKFVYAVQQQHVIRLPVQTGMTEGGMAEIVSGLSDKDEVISSVQGAPPPGSNVKTAPRA